MNRFIQLPLLIILLSLLISCGGGTSVSGEVTFYYEEEVVEPELIAFDIVDSYGTHSSLPPNIELAISPYIGHGEFDLLWDIHTHNHYFVDIYLSRTPHLEQAQLIASQFCELDTSCETDAFMACRYFPHFDIECEDSYGDLHISNIDHLIFSVPDDLYFILDTCDADSDYCEYQAIPVVME